MEGYEPPSGEDGRKSEGDGIVNPFEVAPRLKLKSSATSRVCSRPSCGRPNPRDTKANNAVAVNSGDLIVKADEKGSEMKGSIASAFRAFVVD